MAIVISASRRTDIPAFYMDGFMAALAAGTFQTVNPFNGRKKTVAAGPHDVAAIVLWSKNFGKFLDEGYGQALASRGYHLLFNFTVNSADALLEPHLPPLAGRLTQLAQLCRAFGPETVQWRFDPICHYRETDGPVRDNLTDFRTIAQAAAASGISGCVTSFADPYAKAQKRFAAAGLQMVDPPLSEKIRIIKTLAGVLAGLGMGLSLCCEPDVLSGIGPGLGIRQSRCISHERVMRAYGGTLSGKPDTGQRRSRGCGCHVSVDIGDYRDQPCRHRCLYCYANAA